ncbi:hypothetical protein [Haloferula sp.]|uniref:hypothetical protein n=1 Tax=Haloferula sp. TaxID=2497595 RepID=UPI003C7969DD
MSKRLCLLLALCLMAAIVAMIGFGNRDSKPPPDSATSPPEAPVSKTASAEASAAVPVDDPVQDTFYPSPARRTTSPDLGPRDLAAESRAYTEVAVKAFEEDFAAPMSGFLGSEPTNQEDDLFQIFTMLKYFAETHGKVMPIGNNLDITQQLTTSGNGQARPLAKNHPSINGDGELVDRWGTPYFFHAISSQEMEIRSAGADMRMYTGDDLLYPANRSFEVD